MSSTNNQVQTDQSKLAGKYLTFLLKGQLYGVPVSNVREINSYSEITPIPQTPTFVAGVMNLRGKVIPVINLREKFRFESIPVNKETCIVVIDTQDGQMGVIVDGVSSVLDLIGPQIEPTPKLGEDSVEAFILGLGKVDHQVIILIDVAKTLSKEHLRSLVQVVSDQAA
jgi:purine-binding chemotaxis protein CheW